MTEHGDRERKLPIEQTTFFDFYFGCDCDDEWYEDIEVFAEAIETDSERIFEQKDASGATLLHVLMSRSSLAFDDERAVEWVEAFLDHHGDGATAAAAAEDASGRSPMDYFVEDLASCSNNCTTLVNFLKFGGFHQNDGRDRPPGMGHYRHALPVLKAYPKALFSSKLLFHIAINDEEEPPLKASRALLSMVFPGGLDVVPPPQNGANVDAPLHLAAQYASHDYVQRIFSAFVSPQSARAADADGNLALHLALNASHERSIYRRGAPNTTERRTIPCHPIVRDLVSAYPRSLLIRQGAGVGDGGVDKTKEGESREGLLPIEIACENDCELDVVYYILRRTPDKIRTESTLPSTPSLCVVESNEAKRMRKR